MHAHSVSEIFKHSVVITAFVFVMMIIVDYANVFLKNGLTVKMRKGARQYLAAAILGTIPGCLGAFVAVSMYSRGVISLGALAAAMIATSGDEAFVMLALFPGKALFLFGVLFLAGVFFGRVLDFFATGFHFKTAPSCLHADTSRHGDECKCMTFREMVESLKKMSFSRFLVLAFITLLLCLEFSGSIMGEEAAWMRITFISLTFLSLFVVLNAPDHYLQEHIYSHIIKKHAGRIFLWTFGALLFIHFFLDFADIKGLGGLRGPFLILAAAAVGIIPESGPNLVFVMLYAKGLIPFSVLLANSVVQDGHGMLPLLACSLRDSAWIKAFNFAAGLFLGYLVYLLGY